jgi:tRNA nucleotidyltransferase (CCA-adding enzyme)
LFPEFVQNYAEVTTTLLDTATRTTDPLIRFAALMLNVNPASLTALFERYRIPNEYRELASLLQRSYNEIIASDNSSAEDLLKLLVGLDAWRRPARFQQVLDACVAITPDCAKAAAQLKEAYVVTDAVKPTEFVAQGLQGAAIQVALQEKRLQVLKCHPAPN